MLAALRREAQNREFVVHQRAAAETGTAGAVLEWMCRWLAVAGGLVLAALIVLTVASIAGRALVSLGLGPIPGDFELVEAGTAFAIFCFLPWCHLRRGHISVDVLEKALGPQRDAWLAAMSNTLMTAVALLIVWRMWFGMLDKMKYGETTFILQFPAWWGYAACMPAAVLFASVAAFTVWRSIDEARTGPRA